MSAFVRLGMTQNMDSNMGGRTSSQVLASRRSRHIQSGPMINEQWLDNPLKDEGHSPDNSWWHDFKAWLHGEL